MSIHNVLILGASRGIGRALAIEYATRGCALALAARDVDALRELTRELGKQGGKIVYHRCDVADRAQVHATVEHAKKALGRIDLAILNAGVGEPGWVDGMDAGGVETVFGVNTLGIVYGLEALVPLMKKQGGGIIAGVSSLADARGYPGSAAYCASKAAASTFLESARIELRGSGIRVVTVRPGFVRTDMTAKNEFHMPFLLEPAKAARIIRRRIAMGLGVVQFPWPVVFATRLARIAPNFLFDRLLRAARRRGE
ncbi:MAG: SDR family NAD(P)-dependent oxidoreductase [Ignavibacteria bacterium]|nr:SDR family NAD(P)-dependent oxidoreductase [Ignavibacteria bacterium]